MKILLKRCRILQNESGYSLVGVLLLIVLISVLGLSLMTLTTTSVNTTTSERSDQSTFYIAEAGATMEIAEIESIVNDVYNIVEQSKRPNETEEELRNRFYSELNSRILTAGPKTSPVDFEEAFGEQPKVEIEVDVMDGAKPGTYKITSTGIIGKKKRMVEREFSVDYSPGTGGGGGTVIIPEMAAFVNQTVKLTEGASVTGDIGTRKTGYGSIIVNGGPTVKGSIYVPEGSEHIALQGNANNIPNPKGMVMGELPKLPEFPLIPQHYPVPPNKEVTDSGGYNRTYVIKDGNLLIENWITNNYTFKIQSNLQLNEIRLNQNNNLYLDIGNSDKEIVVKNLNIVNGHIILTGTGKLTIYVTGSISMGSGSTINNNGSVNRLNVFLKGAESRPKVVNLAGAQKIFGSLHAEDANIDFGAGGGFQGNIFTGGKTIKITGGAQSTSPLILAPHADVELSGAGKVTGVVIAHSLTMSGGTNLTYKQMQFTEGPISVEGVGGNSETGGPGTFYIDKQPLKEK